MYFTLMISFAICCKIFEEERNIFPTEGEYYNMFMNELFEGEDLIFECKNCPKNVTLWNTMNIIGIPYNTGYTFRSIANNYTHFVALSDNNTLNIYNQQDQQLKTELILSISQELNCINVIFTLNHKFLLDCYIDNMLYIYYLEGQDLELVFQVTVPYPLKTNLYSFRSYSINYTIYAQYYEEYSILTLFKENTTANQIFVNQSTWISQFEDVEVSIKGVEVNIFYVLDDPILFLLQITEDENITVQNYFFIDSPAYSMTIYQSIKMYSECDQLFLQSESFIYSLLVCEDMLDQELYQQNLMFYNIDENAEIEQFYANDQFLIIYTNNSLMIISTETNTLLTQTRLEYLMGSQIYFNNQNNELFIFNKQTFVYQIEVPKLSGYFQIDFPRDEIYLFALGNFSIEVCFVRLKVKILNLNDYSIYQLYQNQIDNYYQLEQNKFVQQINNIYGPLLEIQYTQNNQDLGTFKDITFDKIYEFQQEFEKMKMLSVQTTYIVGIINKSMTLFAVEFPLQLFKSAVINIILEGDRILRDFQLAYQFQGQQVVLIIGINFGSDILLFYYVSLSVNISPTVLQNSTIQTLHFNQFLLTFNCYILLLDNKILLYSLNNDKQFKVDQDIIENYLGEQIKFNPTQMAMDQQHQSSVVFVSNQNNFIIFVIDFNLRMIPQGIHYVDYIIQQINIVNSKLILAYKCDQGLCFDVWDIQNLWKPFSEKKLISVSQQNEINCYSDNLFYYVKTEKNQILVYNPMLSYHQSLFTSIQINGSYFSSTQVGGFSVIAFGNVLYTLLPYFSFQFIQNDDFQTYEYLPTTIYNFTIKSQLSGDNASYITNNQSLSILNPQLNIFIQDIKLIIQDGSVLKYTYTFDNISTIGQILDFELQAVDDKHQTCIKNQNNFAQLSNQVDNNEYFTIVTVLNNLFVLQNYNEIMIYNTNVVFQLDNAFICFQSYAYNDTLYTQCQNTTNNYLLSFQINNESIIQNDEIIELHNDEVYLSETPFSIYSDCIFYLTSEEQLTYYNYNSQQNVIISSCATKQFETIVIKNAENYSLIVVFFLCSSNQKNLNYIIGNYSKINFTINFQNKVKDINIIDPYLANINDLFFLCFSILKVEFKEIMMLITTNQQISFLILLNVNYGIFDKTDIQIKFQDIISTISPYNTADYELAQTPKFQGTALLIVLTNKVVQNEILFLVYDLSDISQYNRFNPIRVQGGYIIPQIQDNSIFSFELYVESRNKGRILILTQASIYVFEFSTSTFTLEMPLYSSDQNIQFRLTGGNSYYTSTALIEFQYETKKGWLYGLYTILATLFIISLIYCWQRRNKPTDFDLNNDEWIDF